MLENVGVIGFKKDDVLFRNKMIIKSDSVLLKFRVIDKES